MTDHTETTRRHTQPGLDSPAHVTVGGWGSVAEMAETEAYAKAGPGALETLGMLNKAGGTMCTSCAWAKPPQPAAAEFCNMGAKATIWDLTSLRCTPEVLAEHTVSELAGWGEFDLEQLGRLTHPMRYDAASDRYVETTWDEAFAGIAAALNALPPKSTTFYASGKAGLEASYLYALFARVYGHNNLPDSSNMCHETTSVGLKKVIGSPVGTCRMEDLDLCDAIFYLGQNPGTNSPRILHQLKAAAERGCEIIAFNPLKEPGLISFADPRSPWQMTLGRPTTIASQYMQVRPGGDIAALAGVAKHVLAIDAEDRMNGGPGVLDRAFLDEHTHGLDDWMAFIERTSWAAIEANSGIERMALMQAAQVYARAKNVIGIYGMGLTQHVHGSQAIGSLVNLLLLRGNIGRPGAGCNPIRGHSNVQGQRTVGITEKPELAPNDKYRELFGFEPPMDKGHNTVEFLQALLKGEAKGYVGLGGNLARAVPDWDRIAPAWRQMDLTVHIATRLNRTHLLPGKASWLLPCLVRSEADMQATGNQQVSMEDSFSQVYGSIGKRAPASAHLLSETAIVCRMAEATLPAHPQQRWAEWRQDYAQIRELIAKSFPDQFYDMSERMNVPGGFYRGNAARERQWKTETGKAQFTTPDVLDASGLEERAGRYRLVTLRSADQFNTTVYGPGDRLRGVTDDRMIVLMSPDDMAADGLAPHDRISLIGDADDGVARRVDGLRVVPYDLPRGCLGGYFPELNPLSPLSRHDLASHTPSTKSIPVRIAPA